MQNELRATGLTTYQLRAGGWRWETRSDFSDDGVATDEDGRLPESRNCCLMGHSLARPVEDLGSVLPLLGFFLSTGSEGTGVGRTGDRNERHRAPLRTQVTRQMARQQSRQSNPEANLKPPGQVEGIHPELARHGTASSLGTEQRYTGTDLKAATMDEVLHYRALV
ncbi:hypothetical protein pipiens_003012 [Culex pipiens pipiens]|uniref:Uncharacterized protein n=1 Tax=Culex pipiens pipiens TaxID=38569 RepID=A0ABD1D4W0_CULPP